MDKGKRGALAPQGLISISIADVIAMRYQAVYGVDSAGRKFQINKLLTKAIRLTLRTLFFSRIFVHHYIILYYFTFDVLCQTQLFARC